MQDASHDTRVFAQVHHSFLRRTLMCLRSKLMICPCAQAIFSIKPHHYPQETRKLGDNFLEGFADDKPVKKLFSDMYELSCADTSFIPFTMCMMTVSRACVQTGLWTLVFPVVAIPLEDQLVPVLMGLLELMTMVVEYLEDGSAIMGLRVLARTVVVVEEGVPTNWDM